MCGGNDLGGHQGTTKEMELMGMLLQGLQLMVDELAVSISHEDQARTCVQQLKRDGLGARVNYKTSEQCWTGPKGHCKMDFVKPCQHRIWTGARCLGSTGSKLVAAYTIAMELEKRPAPPTDNGTPWYIESAAAGSGSGTLSSPTPTTTINWSTPDSTLAQADGSLRSAASRWQQCSRGCGDGNTAPSSAWAAA